MQVSPKGIVLPLSFASTQYLLFTDKRNWLGGQDYIAPIKTCISAIGFYRFLAGNNFLAITIATAEICKKRFAHITNIFRDNHVNYFKINYLYMKK